MFITNNISVRKLVSLYGDGIWLCNFQPGNYAGKIKSRNWGGWDQDGGVGAPGAPFLSWTHRSSNCIQSNCSEDYPETSSCTTKAVRKEPHGVWQKGRRSDPVRTHTRTWHPKGGGDNHRLPGNGEVWAWSRALGRWDPLAGLKTSIAYLRAVGAWGSTLE